MKKLLYTIDKAWNKWSEKGMRWPFVHDPVKKKPSVTLLFFYIAFTITACSIATSSFFMILKGELLKSTIMPIMMWFSAFVFYRLRRLDSVKINLEERSVELDGGDEN